MLTWLKTLLSGRPHGWRNPAPGDCRPLRGATGGARASGAGNS